MSDFDQFLSDEEGTLLQVHPSRIEEFTEDLLYYHGSVQVASVLMDIGRELLSVKNWAAASVAFRLASEISTDSDQQHKANRKRTVACVRQLQAGTEDRDLAFKQIVDLYWKHVFRICSRKARSADVEDLMQATFLNAYSSIDDCIPERFGGWIGRIALNQSIDRIRSTKAQPPTVSLSGDFDSRDSDNDATEFRSLSSRDFFESIVKPVLSAEDYVVAWQYYGEDSAVNQIAEDLQKTAGQIKHQLRRIRDELRDHLGDDFGD